MSRTTSAMRRYIDDTFAAEDALLQQVRAAGEALRPGMQLSAGEGKLLQFLLRLAGAQRVLEVGCFMGYSAIWMARALPEDGELITLEANADYAALARAHFKRAQLPITLLEGKAMELLDEVAGSFDVVFIDADKTHYAHYLEACWDKLNPGGLMIGDNTLLFGAMHGEPRQKTSAAAQEAMQRFNARLAEEGGVLIPTDEGLTLAQKPRSGR